jgi:uroporphyrin-III C-methyltransferase
MGRVIFIGAGPGAADLITLRGAQRLAQAEIVLFDALTDPAFHDFAPQAQWVDVGKRGFCDSMAQVSINALLVRYGKNFSQVVRLKGGDPSVFARLEEELQALQAEGLEFEIVPGVTSASAAAAAAGIPLTRRLTARRVQFVTGHDVAGGLPEDLNLQALADPLATTVIFMGKRTFAALSLKLIAAGLPQDTPALLAESVSTPDQRLTRATVATLGAALADAHDGPALILIGPLMEGI